MRVFVLLFNAGTENMGIHTIQIGDRNTILMFEIEDDATRYAMLLEAQDFLTPSVEAIDAEEVKEFCNDNDFDWKFIPENFVPSTPEDRLLLSPPERNAENMDWKPEIEETPEMEDSELDRIRRQLEGLL